MARGTEWEAPSFFHDLVEERPEEKILFHIQKSIPRQKEKGILQRIFLEGVPPERQWRRKEARMESPRERSVRFSTKPPRTRRVRSQSLRDTKYVRISSYRRSTIDNTLFIVYCSDVS